MYNYLEAMKNDITEYINDNINLADYADRDELESYLMMSFLQKTA